MTEIGLRRAKATAVKADALVVGVVQSGDGAVAAEGAAPVAAAYGRSFPAVLSALAITGKQGEVAKLPAGDGAAADVLVVVGLGPVDKLDDEVIRRAAGEAVRALAGTGRVAFALPAATLSQVRAVADGALLGAYAYTRYRTQEQPTPVREVVVITDLARRNEAQRAVAAAEVVARAVHLARDWVNTPAADLVPATFAAAVVSAARRSKVKVDVVDERGLAAGGYGGILGVGQGSANPPRLVRMSYRPRKPRRALAYVGKGITFDSGGLSLKQGQHMMTMKCDMAGAAAVAAAVLAAAELDLPVEVTGWLCIAENMPSGDATRPGDVLTTYSGTTVEVLNTDAEGRLVLADGLAKAGEKSPDLVVDVATLTGACVIALGDRVSGVFANDDDLHKRLPEVAARAGEAMWPLPIPEEMREKVRSTKVADLGNHNTDGYGGALYAAAFLREFVPEGQRWVHLDIAGPAFNERDPFGYTPKGGTGAAVRTLVALVEASAAGAI